MSETSEQATRRRWVTLAEVVAVAGVVIAALSLYLTWSDKREERADKASTAQIQTHAASVITLRATRVKGGDRLTLTDVQHPVDAIDVTFPATLKIAPHETILQPAIEADWIESTMLALTDAKTGRLPVLIASTFWDGETKRTDRAIYDLIWRRDGGLFGTSLKLDGAVLRQRGGDQARLDAIWKTIAPKPKT